jgi:Rha family phage regulatory protein
METLDLTAFIVRDGRDLITDSRAVAIAFGKRHKNVLQTIDRMLRSGRPLIAEHARLNFQPCAYEGGNGKKEPMFRMTAKGLSELAMSFSGDDAREVRIRFLNAFEEVASRLERAERSITERMHALELREAPSKVKGQVGSRLMNERRREKPEFQAERSVLEALAQPKLPFGIH